MAMECTLHCHIWGWRLPTAPSPTLTYVSGVDFPFEAYEAFDEAVLGHSGNSKASVDSISACSLMQGYYYYPVPWGKITEYHVTASLQYSNEPLSC